MVRRFTTVSVFTRVFQRVTHRFSSLRILSLVTSALVVVSCASAQPEWKQVTDQEAKLLFGGSGLDIKTTNRRQYDGKSIFIESVDLEHSTGRLAGSGNLVFYETPKFVDTYFYDDGKTLSEKITGWFETDTKIEFGQNKEEENHMGPYNQQRFTLDRVYDCVAIEQYLGPVSIDPLQGGKVALGTIVVDGYYCAGGNDFLSESQIKTLFDAIDVPSRPKEEVRAY